MPILYFSPAGYFRWLFLRYERFLCDFADWKLHADVGLKVRYIQRWKVTICSSAALQCKCRYLFLSISTLYLHLRNIVLYYIYLIFCKHMRMFETWCYKSSKATVAAEMKPIRQKRQKINIGNYF